MAALTRKTLIQFGSSGPSSSFGQFGSKEAGVPQTSQNPTVIQQLAAWVQGWQNAVVGGDKAAYLEDMNGWCYVHSYMTAYIFQMGIPEWDSGTTYYLNSIVQGAAGGASAGQWFKSLQDDNLNNTPPTSADNAFWEWINPPLPNIPNVGNGVASNVVLNPNAGSPSTKVDVTADQLSVQGFVASPLSVINDSTVTGVNGIDTGVRTLSSQYYLWAIYNSTSATFASLLSLSATAPTMPAGYAYKRLVGAVATDSANNFIQFYQAGNEVVIAPQTVFQDQAGVLVYTSQALPIPTIAKVVSGNMGIGPSNNVDRSMQVAADANGLGAVSVGTATDTSLDGFTGVGMYRTMVKTPQAIYWRTADTNSYYRLSVSGYAYNLF